MTRPSSLRCATRWRAKFGTHPSSAAGVEYNIAVRRGLSIGCRLRNWTRLKMGTRPRRPRLFGIDPSQKLPDIAMQQLPAATVQTTGENLPLMTLRSTSRLQLELCTTWMRQHRLLAKCFGPHEISDHNNFVFGSIMARRIRLALYSCGLFGMAAFVKQGFRRQGYSQERWVVVPPIPS